MKKNTFRLGACIYAGILAVLITVLLIVFFCFISAFEKTRPESFMRSYISENEKKGWDKAIAGAPLAGVHTPFESEAYLRSKLTDMYFSPDTEEKKNVTFYKKSGKYTSERPVYAIYFSDTEMLELTLEKNSEKTTNGENECQI